MKVLTGWTVRDYIPLYAKEEGVEVNCLEVKSKMIDDLGIDITGQDFPITAYNDGSSWTGYMEQYYDVEAYCGNEDYEGNK
jgi:hypothetical protein